MVTSQSARLTAVKAFRMVGLLARQHSSRGTLTVYCARTSKPRRHNLRAGGGVPLAQAKRIERTTRTLVRAAHDFCRADEAVLLFRRLRSELYRAHDPFEGVCCLRVPEPRDPEFPKA